VLRCLGTPTILWAGVAAPILFTGIYLIGGAIRPGYDPMRHVVSLLSLGDGGWIQVASFIVNGALLVAFAVALRARLHDGPGAMAGPAAIGATGLGMVVAGVFSTQPLFGYPPGTPTGMATVVEPASVLHLIGALLLFVGLVVAAFVFARRFRQERASRLATVSLVAGVVVFVFFGASSGGPSGQLFPEVSGLLQRISLVTGLGWVAAIAALEVHSLRS
jgi:hypothetical protein